MLQLYLNDSNLAFERIHNVHASFQFKVLRSTGHAVFTICSKQSCEMLCSLARGARQATTFFCPIPPTWKWLPDTHPLEHVPRSHLAHVKL